MAETRADNQTALRTQNQPPMFAQLYLPTGINAYKLCPRMLYTEQYRTECPAKKPGDQSRPRRKRVDSMQTSSLQQRALATPAEARSSRSTLQQKKASPRGKNVCARTPTGSDDRSRDHRNEPRVTLKLKLKPTGS